MSWKTKLENELTKIAQSGISADGQRLVVDVPPGRLVCELLSVDTVGCSTQEVALATDLLAGNTMGELKALSEKLSQQINYLLEPISPIEIDHEGASVQMRSNPPQKDDDGTKYYELLVRRDGLSLQRYSRPKGGQRQVVPANLTREVLLRLAGDFVDAVE